MNLIPDHLDSRCALMEFLQSDNIDTLDDNDDNDHLDHSELRKQKDEIKEVDIKVFTLTRRC